MPLETEQLSLLQQSASKKSAESIQNRIKETYSYLAEKLPEEMSDRDNEDESLDKERVDDEEGSSQRSRSSDKKVEEPDIKEDNFGNISKWEEQNKESEINEINEIESLEYSVKREELFNNNNDRPSVTPNDELS